MKWVVAGRVRPVRLGACLLLLLGACGWDWAAHRLRGYDREIESAGRNIGSAGTDALRARAYAARGRGYSEKSRYSRQFKLLPVAESDRLFDLALQDLDRAVALAPGDVQVYLERGRSYHDRAVLEAAASPRAGALFRSAEADFTRAIAVDASSAQAFDMRGIVHTALGELDQAIDDFAEEAKLEPRYGRLQLAAAYCRRAAAAQRAQSYDPAIADYEKSIELGGVPDACDCQPETPLAWLYLEKRQYDRSWGVVGRAAASGRGVDPEVLERLIKESGRGR